MPKMMQNRGQVLNPLYNTIQYYRIGKERKRKNHLLSIPLPSLCEKLNKHGYTHILEALT